MRLSRKAGLLGKAVPANLYKIYVYHASSGEEELWGTALAGSVVDMDYTNEYGEIFVKAEPYLYNSGIAFESRDPIFTMPECDVYVEYSY